MNSMFKRVIVTGASSGIGAAIAKELCLANSDVIAVGRDRKKLQAVKGSLPVDKQSHFKAVVADIAMPEGIARIIKSAQPINKIDALVNNAGFGTSKLFENHSEEEIDSIISTNLSGTLKLTHRVLNRRSKRSPIHVVFVSSLAGKIGFPELSVYSATKFALEGFAESLRSEHSTKQLKVSVLRPGVTDSNFFNMAGMKKYYEDAKQSNQLHSSEFVAKTFLKNIGKPVVIVGSDKYFVKLLPFIPFNRRFQVLGITNRLDRSN